MREILSRNVKCKSNYPSRRFCRRRNVLRDAEWEEEDMLGRRNKCANAWWQEKKQPQNNESVMWKKEAAEGEWVGTVRWLQC